MAIDRHRRAVDGGDGCGHAHARHQPRGIRPEQLVDRDVAVLGVDPAFGEVAAEDKDPTLLITDSPRFVRAKTAFTLKVSTRNLVRDRFLGAAVGGYYLESSVLTAGGIQRDSRDGIRPKPSSRLKMRLKSSSKLE